MLQQTRMEVVLGRFDAFLQRFPTLHSLATASEDDVTAAWSGLGYYRRARMLRTAAIAVIDRFDGHLPKSVEELMSIDGIGRYTAGAIASIAYNRRTPIVDGNIKRIVSRLFATHRDPWKYETQLVDASKSPRMFNQALMEIGALVCKPRNPSCGSCPLRSDCAAFQRGVVHRYPRIAKKVTTRVTLPLYVITDQRGRLLLRRGDSRLFVLPDEGSGKLLGSFQHTIMNRRITFEVFTARRRPRRPVRRRPAGDVWIDPNDLANLPHPSYVRKALHVAGIV